MKNLKKFATTLALAGIIMMGASSAKAGLLMSDFANSDTNACTSNGRDARYDEGLLMSDFTGIIMGGFTGIIMGGGFYNQDCVQLNSGVMLAD